MPFLGPRNRSGSISFTVWLYDKDLGSIQGDMRTSRTMTNIKNALWVNLRVRRDLLTEVEVLASAEPKGDGISANSEVYIP